MGIPANRNRVIPRKKLEKAAGSSALPQSLPSLSNYPSHPLVSLLVNNSALHHEAHSGELADIGDRIAFHGDNVRQLARLDRAEVVALTE